MSKHTPVPWKVNRSIDRVTIQETSAGRWIATIAPVSDSIYNENPETQSANADFIVRACNAHDDLLAACKLVAYYTPLMRAAGFTDLAMQCAKAIAKAEGEVQS